MKVAGPGNGYSSAHSGCQASEDLPDFAGQIFLLHNLQIPTFLYVFCFLRGEGKSTTGDSRDSLSEAALKKSKKKHRS